MKFRKVGVRTKDETESEIRLIYSDIRLIIDKSNGKKTGLDYHLEDGVAYVIRSTGRGFLVTAAITITMPIFAIYRMMSSRRFMEDR